MEIAVAASVAWLAAFLAAHLAGGKAKRAVGAFAVLSPLIALALIAALVGAPKQIGGSDKMVFGCAIVAYATGVLAAVELLFRGKPRWPWVLALLIDAAIPVGVFFIAVVAGTSPRD
jgi:hypothetical protein